MSIVIDDPRVEALAREIAAREDLTPAQAVRRALEHRLAAAATPDMPGAENRERARTQLAGVQARLAARGGDWPSWDEMKAWGQDGRG